MHSWDHLCDHTCIFRDLHTDLLFNWLLEPMQHAQFVARDLALYGAFWDA